MPGAPVVWEVTRRWGDEILSVDFSLLLPSPLESPGTLDLGDGTVLEVRPTEIPDRIGLLVPFDRSIAWTVLVSAALHVAIAAWIFLVPPDAAKVSTVARWQRSATSD